MGRTLSFNMNSLGYCSLLIATLLIMSAVLCADINHNFSPFVSVTRNSVVYVFASQSDGRYLVGGVFDSANCFGCGGLVRFNPDGTIDDTFRPSGGGRVNAIVIQPDGKILVAGGYSVNLSGMIRNGLVRLNPDGSIDESLLKRKRCFFGKPDLAAAGWKGGALRKLFQYKRHFPESDRPR